MSARPPKYLAVAIVLVTLTLTALALAQGTTQLAAATFLELDYSLAPATAAVAAVETGRQEKDDTHILRRQIFDPELGPIDGQPVSEDAGTEDADVETTVVPNGDPNNAPPCEGSIRLVAAVVSPRNPELSFASIIGTAGNARLYRVGQSVDGKPVTHIGARRVVLQPGGNYCHIAMFDEAEAAAAPQRASGRPAPAAPVISAAAATERPGRPGAREGAISTADMESGIRRNSDTNFTIQRSFVDQLLENQTELMRSARVIPHEQDGRVQGVKLYGIRRNSVLGRLGVQNGDMLRTINGYDMSSPDSALEAYARLRSADNLSVAVVRRGQPMTLDYNIQ